jgi:hypothetical protein
MTTTTNDSNKGLTWSRETRSGCLSSTDRISIMYQIFFVRLGRVQYPGVCFWSLYFPAYAVDLTMGGIRQYSKPGPIVTVISAVTNHFVVACRIR